MRPRDKHVYEKFNSALESFHSEVHPLPGVQTPERRISFLEQVMESIHRVQYVQTVMSRDISLKRCDPNDPLFDPLLAAILFYRKGDFNEACWLIFLFVHFGKHPKSKWRYASSVYGNLGSAEKWTWRNVTLNFPRFREWLAKSIDAIKGDKPRGFGNHRKYESLDACTPKGTGAVIESYIKWVGPTYDHFQLFEAALKKSNNDPKTAFDTLFQSMSSVVGFGRTAKFDYLTMISKLKLAKIEPGSTYICSSTGPIKGARLLFGNVTPKEAESLLAVLNEHTQVGMQVLEDSLCNWQKSPDRFKPFRG